MELLRVAFQAADSACPAILRVSGDVDMLTAPVFRTALQDGIQQAALSAAPLVVELSGLDLLSSAGVQVLAEAQTRADEDRVKLRIVANAPTRRVLQITKLDAVLDMYETLGAALAMPGTPAGQN